MLQNLLSIYTEPILQKRVERLCRITWDDSQKRSHIQENARLWILSGYNTQVHSSLAYRYPVYIGNPLPEYWHEQKMRDVLGYTSHQVQAAHKNNRARYIISAPAWTKHGWLTVLHTWGVNLESEDTEDYGRFVQHGSLRRTKYARTVQKICYGLGYTATKLGINTLHLPLIGLGAFLSALYDSEDVAFCFATFGKALHNTASRFPKLQINVYMQHKPHFPVETRPQPKNLRFVNRSLFNLKPPFHRQALVNAWDSHSFVGNGGVFDASVDGFWVSGRKNPLKNTSFLHHPYLIPQLLKPQNWHRVPNL